GNPYTNNSIELIQQFNSGILRLFIDKQNRIWLGTTGEGIYVLDEKGEKILHHFTSQDSEESSLANNRVTDIIQYNDSLFLATTGALSMLNMNSKNIIKKTIHNGLPSAFVSQMSLDKEGLLWLITNNGLSSYNIKKDLFTVYNQREGIVF